jgi:hypothetical protein
LLAIDTLYTIPGDIRKTMDAWRREVLVLVSSFCVDMQKRRRIDGV